MPNAAARAKQQGKKGELSKPARLMRWYRAEPSAWVKQHIKIELARYRDQVALESWLEKCPPGSHQWARQRLASGGLTLDSSRSYQADALDAMATPGFYAFKWANGTAKTTTAALFVLWFLDCYPGGKLLTTAGTWSQLREQLWREIGTWADRPAAPHVVALSRVDKTQIDVAPDWAAFGRAADKAATFEGVHGPYVAVLMDEAKAIHPDIFGAVRRILRGNPGGLFWWIALSSPGSRSGPFYDICHGDQSHRWNVSAVSAYESERVSLEQLEADRQDIGEDGPLFVSMNIGDFPDESDDTVILLSWAQAAVGRQMEVSHRNYLGLDVARYGSAETVFAGMAGRTASILATYQGKSLTETAGRLVALSPSYAGIGVDDVGVGGGITDIAREKGIGVLAFNAGAAPADPRFVNLGTEAMWQLRRELEAGYQAQADPAVGISLPDDKRLLHQLTARRYEFRSDGKIRVESKEAMAARGEKSPDRADALTIANHVRLSGARAAGADEIAELYANAKPEGMGALRRRDF